MAIHVALNHKTHYRYDRPVLLGPQIVRLRPAPHCRTPILAYSQKVLPANHFINWQQDPQANYLARLFFPERTTEFSVEVDLVVEMATYNPFDFFLEDYAEHYPFRYEDALARDLRPYLEAEVPGPKLAAYLSQIPRSPTRTVSFIVDLNQRVKRDLGYIIRLEHGVQTCDQTLTLRSGSCRDSAWLLVQILRNLGFAARFVSGYSIQLTPDVKPLEGPSGVAADFADLHAWAEVFLPGAGWIGLDPTSGDLASEGHIPLACTSDAGSAAPISGTMEFCETEDFSFSVTVQRIFESPRVTKPYTDQQWAQIEALGHQVDVDMRLADVRLTMGGEPTFVSLDDPNGSEWSTTAMSPAKRRLAGELLLRMRDRFSTGALLHTGQGKWYPGEALPRWALGCYWRKDGVAIWENQNLLAQEEKAYGYGAEDARTFLQALTRRLQVSSSFIISAHEDIFFNLWKERRLPELVDPLDPKLKEFSERARLAQLFDKAADEPAGFVLPLRRIPTRSGLPRWTSQPWFPFVERLFLTPGDSPMGYRLPLEALPWTKPEDLTYAFEADPLRRRDELPPRPPRRMNSFSAPAPSDEPIPPADKAEPNPESEKALTLTRPALCVQAREGKIYIFMPPVDYIADYLDLAAAIEDTAAHLAMPVLIEGSTLPNDPRFAVFKVTPDPGVIEVNIQPASSWDELVENTTALYDLARQTRLGAEKFMLDGQHTGTGGGNHLVIGGPTPDDSAFLRRPDLLRSMVNYWQNHPALSYLLSGLFIGPTSQHPRIDEGRDESLYELEIAFSQIPERLATLPSSHLTDRTFRHLLIDVTGSTHRAEFCIDKLDPPEGAGSRLGLLELRAFEMPPHARMSLTQQLLVRALIAQFWRKPYRQKLVSWGTSLHDRFMLPHYVQMDWEDVVTELNRAGYRFQGEWFAPHFEFRFPLIGTVTVRGIQLELRHALEPWNVLGEEASSGGTARSVDSSVERLQVKVTGMVGSRYAVLCNGRPVPLRPTGTAGESVAGVRYRAWQPSSCLHPDIPVHSPLVFDIVDTWSNHAIGGCTYHVIHPGGRAYETHPVNASEAESRRLARFSGSGHTPGPITVPKERPNPDFPLTLDLRRSP
jgi:uncharacterized protein (DUF2126 family)/transglutaminase-like putative cysteine protease